MNSKKALLIIDLQNDFLPGGALAVSEGDMLLPLVNALMPYYDLRVATQDWHPANHVSFDRMHPEAKVGDVIEVGGLTQELWPVHCVQQTYGSAFASELQAAQLDCVIQKGANADIDSYSGFYDNGGQDSTGLTEYLHQQGVSEVHIVGVATDYCVKFTALDALMEGFKTVVIEDACRGVDLKKGDIDRALLEIQSKGGTVKRSDTIFSINLD